MAQYIVNKTGTVHSIPDAWLREKLASGYRLADQDEIDAEWERQGLEGKAPTVKSLAKDHDDYEASFAERSMLEQSTTIGPRPGDVDVRLTEPGDAGFAVGADGMRQVPSRITTASLNETAGPNTDGVSEQDGHTYEVVVPTVAKATARRAAGVPTELAAQMRSVEEGFEPSGEPTSTDGPAPVVDDVAEDGKK